MIQRKRQRDPWALRIAKNRLVTEAAKFHQYKNKLRQESESPTRVIAYKDDAVWRSPSILKLYAVCLYG